MLIVALVLFAVAALGGIVLFTQHRREKGPSLPLALVHGLVAAAGLVVLIVAVVGGIASSLPVIALILFLIAALGGFYLIATHLRTRRGLPTPIVVVHALVAVVSFVILLIGALQVGG